MVEELKTFYNNVRLVSTNLGDLETLIAESKASVIALTETWFKNENDVELYSIGGDHGPFTVACGDFNIDLLNVYLAARETIEYLMSSQGLDLVSLRDPTRDTATSCT